jgi:hypothetical protein
MLSYAHVQSNVGPAAGSFYLTASLLTQILHQLQIKPLKKIIQLQLPAKVRSHIREYKYMHSVSVQTYSKYDIHIVES